MKRSKIFLSASALLLTIAGVYATKARTTQTYTVATHVGIGCVQHGLLNQVTIGANGGFDEATLNNKQLYTRACVQTLKTIGD